MAVPTETPVTIPDDVSTVATAELDVLHDPPAGLPVNVLVYPLHTENVPPIVCPEAVTADPNNHRVIRSV